MVKKSVVSERNLMWRKLLLLVSVCLVVAVGDARAFHQVGMNVMPMILNGSLLLFSHVATNFFSFHLEPSHSNSVRRMSWFVLL